MILLITGIIAFASIHLTSAIPSAEAALRAKTGDLYRAIFGLLLLAALMIIVVGWRASPFVPLYDPPVWGRYGTFVVVLFAFFCLGVFSSAASSGNGCGFRWRSASPCGPWATCPPMATGRARSCSAGMGIYALAHIAIATANGIRPSPEVRSGHDGLSLSPAPPSMAS